MTVRVLNRGAAAASVFESILRHMTSEAETVVRSRDGASVVVLIDPDSLVFSETEGGGREVVSRVVFSSEPDALLRGEFATSDGVRWVVQEAERERIYGEIVGDRYSMDRVFGASL